MPNRGLHLSVRGYGATFLDFSLDMFGYLQVMEGQFGDVWTSNVMMFIGPRFYLRHPENLSGGFVGTGIGTGWKSIQVDYELWGVSLGTETEDYFALTGMVCFCFNLMFTNRFGIIKLHRILHKST